MVWGADGNPVLLRGDFDRHLQDEGLTPKRSPNVTPPARSNSSLSWRRKSSLSSPTESHDSFDTVSDAKDVSEYQEEVEVSGVDRERKFVSRARTRISQMARNTGEIGLKIVALPTVVLLDMLS